MHEGLELSGCWWGEEVETERDIQAGRGSQRQKDTERGRLGGSIG